MRYSKQLPKQLPPSRNWPLMWSCRQRPLPLLFADTRPSCYPPHPTWPDPTQHLSFLPYLIIVTACGFEIARDLHCLALAYSSTTGTPRLAMHSTSKAFLWISKTIILLDCVICSMFDLFAMQGHLPSSETDNAILFQSIYTLFSNSENVMMTPAVRIWRADNVWCTEFMVQTCCKD